MLGRHRPFKRAQNACKFVVGFGGVLEAATKGGNLVHFSCSLTSYESNLCLQRGLSYLSKFVMKHNQKLDSKSDLP